MAQGVDRSELWEFYRKAGLFSTASRMQRLARSFSTAEETWDKLLVAPDDIIWHFFERVEEELRSSCVVYRHTIPTRIFQHWLSLRNPLGSMKTLMQTVGAFQEDKPDRFLRTFFRPNNPLGIRLFRSLYEIFPGEAASLQEYEILRVGTQAAEGDSVLPLNDVQLNNIRSAIVDKIGRIEAQAEGLDGEDALCTSLGDLYARAGLLRERAVFPCYERGHENDEAAVTALIIADYSSFGLSLSGFNNVARIIELSPIGSPEEISDAVTAVRNFYASRGLEEFTLFVDPVLAVKLGRLGSESQGHCYMATFDMSGEFRDIIIRHIRAFYEARVGLARIVTDLSEDELDWVNEVGQRMAFQAGEFIVKENEMADCLFLLQSGEVGVYRGAGRERVQLAICQAPDVVGEIGVLQGVRRTATIVALTPVIALKVSKDKLVEFFRIFPEGGHSLKQALMHRIDHDRKVEHFTNQWKTPLDDRPDGAVLPGRSIAHGADTADYEKT